MAWRLEGTYFENCNCNVLCPCGASFFALPADNERCYVVLVFHVDSVEGQRIVRLTVTFLWHPSESSADEDELES